MSERVVHDGAVEEKRGQGAEPLRVREQIKVYQGEAVLGALWVMKALCKPSVLYKIYRALLIRLIRKTGLFDRAYYLETNGDVAQAGALPLRHYVDYGDREGRSPTPFFQPVYYRSRARGRTKHVNALVHYALVGRYRRISPSPRFDVRYYLSCNKDVARSGLDPLLHYLKFGRPEGRRTLPIQPNAETQGSDAGKIFHQGKLQEEAEALAAAIALDDRHAEWHFRLGQILDAMKKWPGAEEAFRDAIECDNSKAEYYNKLAGVLRKQGKWWQEVEALESAIALDARHATWHYRLGEAREAMNRFGQAAEAYKAAISLKADDANWHFKLGYALEQAEQPAKARMAYSEAVKRDPTKLSQRFGIGTFHQNRGHWVPSAKAYAEQTKIDPLNAELHYRLGMAYDRCYEWDKAEEAYITALSLDTSQAEWHYRLGFVRERMGQWDGSAQAYAYAATSSKKHKPFWYYRLGYVLAKAGRIQEACNAFLETELQKTLDRVPEIQFFEQTKQVLPTLEEGGLPTEQDASALDPQGCYLQSFSKIKFILRALENDKTRAEWHYQLGNEYERSGAWEKAGRAYSDAVARKEDHTPLWYYRLGYALTKTGRYQEACEAFRETRILKKPYGVSEDEYNKSAGFKAVADYCEYFQALRLQDKSILYESFHGVTMSCNPYAIFKHLLERTEFKDWTHIWVLNQKDKIPQSYRLMRNVIFVSRKSDLYLRYLASATFLINNVSFPEYFMRKDGQYYLNTWHGTPLKYLGKDIKGEFFAHKNITKNFLQTTHIISPNPHTTDVLTRRYDIHDIYDGIVAETGYPRVDMTLNMANDGQLALKQRLGIDGASKVVLYAPTWRGIHGDAVFDTERLVDDIDALRKTGCHILFRGHHMIEKYIGELPIGDCVVPPEIDSNELLSIADVLVTDYSSIAFDFMATGKPIVYHVYDIETYEQERGLYFSIEEMPGEISRTADELKTAVDRSLATHETTASYKAAQLHFCKSDDGQAARRVVDLYFFNKKGTMGRKDGSRRKSLLFYGGPFMPNGILTSYLNLLTHIDPNTYDLTIVVDPEQISSYPERIEQFKRLPDHIRVIGRAGRMVLSLEEKWVINEFNSQNLLANSDMMAIYKQAFDREYLRMFGHVVFDSVIQFEGYSRFWLSVFACAPSYTAIRKVAYLHNDMLGEWTLRFPYLAGHFEIYRLFDSLVSVSKQTSDHNRENLAAKFSITNNKFDFCDNLQNPEQIFALSEEPLNNPDDAYLFEGTSPKFITMGRLSPEKDQAKLIRAFASLVSEYEDARLLILGDGPSRQALVHLINDLELSRHVHLLGRRFNPFPYLRKADCFVLSSNHEGQPMVLFEAMILGKPVIATDIVGSRSVLEGRYGLLVDNSEDGLLKGMLQFAEGTLSTSPFDYHEYQTNALKMFYEKVAE